MEKEITLDMVAGAEALAEMEKALAEDVGLKTIEVIYERKEIFKQYFFWNSSDAFFRICAFGYIFDSQGV